MSKLGVYNGWDGATRDARYKEYLKARKDGRIPPPMQCEICGQTKGKVMHHAEQYGPTQEDYFKSLHALCVLCHGMLHVKKRFPGRWQQHLRDAAKGPLPITAHMGIVYDKARRWKDLPFEKCEGDKWYHAI